MLIYIISGTLFGAILIFWGYHIWKEEDLRFFSHGFVMNLEDEEIPIFAKKYGISLIYLGISVIVLSIIYTINTSIGSVLFVIILIVTFFRQILLYLDFK